MLALELREPPRLAAPDVADEQRHRLLGGPPDGETPELRRRRHAAVAAHGDPGVTMVRTGVDEHAVHVEDDGARRDDAHFKRYRGASARNVSSAASRYCASVQRAACSAGTVRPSTNWPSRVRVSSSASSASRSGLKSASGAAASSSCSFLNHARPFTRRSTGPRRGALRFQAAAQRFLSACSGPTSKRKRTAWRETATLKWQCFL